jgi:small-conductance mechanosensitive channel
VTDILLDIAHDHGQVQRSPPPQVLLEDFGAATLDFVLHYWVNVLPETDTRQIASDIRHMIEKRLREAGICFTSPERDIHLDTDEPLKIELVAGEHGDRPGVAAEAEGTAPPKGPAGTKKNSPPDKT